MNPKDLLNLITSRRSSVLIDRNRSVDDSVVIDMITAAQYAPNHKRTWPARFAVVSGESRFQLGNAIADSMVNRGDDAAKVEKTRTKYTRSPIVIVVASAQGTSPTETSENTSAVAAGIQNMLLIAHANGLMTLWGSPAKGSHHAITSFCGFDESDQVLGLIYVGWPTQQIEHVERPSAIINYLK